MFMFVIYCHHVVFSIENISKGSYRSMRMSWSIFLHSVVLRPPLRLHPLSLSRFPEHQQSRTDGGSVRSSQSGVSCQQLHQCSQPRPQHWLQPQSWGEQTSDAQSYFTHKAPSQDSHWADLTQNIDRGAVKIEISTWMYHNIHDTTFSIDDYSNVSFWN